MPSHPQTFGDLIDQLRAAGFCDNTNHEDDEYLSPVQWVGETRIELSAWRNLPLYDKDTWHVACFWVVGGSEGFYAHVEQITANDASERKAVCRLVGKFWTRQRAQDCANLAQRLVNGYGE